jgi:Helix-turn-helix domain
MNNPDLNEQLARIEGKLDQLLERELVKDFYEIGEFAQLVGKAEFTVREWARHGRIRATKKKSGRGPHPLWVISHEELLRYRRDGLLPFATSNGRAAP